jgi:[ribosomal protein S18]-alanine N-acetyltransferase
MAHASDVSITIRPLAGDAEARACAAIMATNEPWITLGRSYDGSVAVVTDAGAETYVALAGEEVVGFVVLIMRGAFTGYIRSIATHPDWRSRGIGARIMAHAEARIFRESPNVFLCVSSFNPRAQAFYRRLGYEVIGELRDYIVRGHSEWLLRKTTGPLSDRR